jgi:hypothetical protein
MTRVFAVLTSLAIAAFAMSLTPTYATDSLKGWQLKDLSGAAMQLEAVDQSPTDVTFSFKNVSGRTISAYLVCFSRGGPFTSCHHNDWYETDEAGLPAAQSDQLIISSGEAAQYPNRTVEISAVIFEDGAGQGSDPSIESIEMKRLGRALETRRTGLAFSSLETAPTDAELNRLAARLGPQPKPEPAFFSEYSRMEVPGLSIPDLNQLSRRSRGAFLTGVSTARHDARRSIDDIRKLPASGADSNGLTRSAYLAGLKQQLDDRASKLIDICKRGGRRAK